MPEEKPEKKIQSKDDSLDTPKKKKKKKIRSKDEPLDTPKKKKKKKKKKKRPTLKVLAREVLPPKNGLSEYLLHWL